jgi:hypothetical protein
MGQGDALDTTQVDAESSARLAVDQDEPLPPVSRTAAGLSRQITALERLSESLGNQVEAALKRGEDAEATSLRAAVRGVHEERKRYQSLLDRER